MAHVLSLENTLGAGQRLKSDLASAEQGREFNSLRLSGERQRQDIAKREFTADEQQANRKKLIVGIDILEQDLSQAPLVLDELSRSQILPAEAIPDMLLEAQNSPETFKQKMARFKNRLMFQSSQAPTQPKFGAAQAATRDGENVLIQTSPSGVTQEIEGFGPATGIAAAGAAERFFGSLTADLSEEQKADARLIQLGLEARAGTTSSRERIATDEDLTESVAESEATIAQRRKFGEATGALRSKLIDKGFSTVQSINVNIRNLDKAIAAIDEGASTGVIESRFFPTIRKSTVLLEQIQSELGLDVVGGVTFGALSKGELDLALTVALPLGLQPPELRQWLEDKKSAQGKLRDYYAEQIDFLDQGGSVAGFLRAQERSGTKNKQQLIEQAQQAIQAGANRDAVLQRLNDLGVDTSGL